MSEHVALITGAASGIGRATAERLGRDGCAVMVADRDTEAAAASADALAHAGVDAASVSVDVADPEQVEAAVVSTAERLGAPTVLVNCAGVTPAQVPLHQYSLEAWQRELAINLSGSFHAIRFAVPHMLATGGGAIVNVASIMGSAGSPDSAGYVASKHGVVGLTKAAALDYAEQGVRVNAVAPGVIETPMSAPMRADEQVRGMLTAATPMGHFGQPEDVAALIGFLCSAEAGFITGQLYPVDGGYLVP